MDLAEKKLLIKFLDGLATTETEVDKKETEGYISEPSVYIEKLKKRVQDISNSNNFNTGDIVVWKEGLKNKRFPNYLQPAIVLDVINPPLFDDEPTNNELLNLKLGFIHEDDEFIVFNFDGNRFKHYNK